MPPAEPEMLTIVREFNAPRDLVFQAWTEPDHIKQWWGPKDFSCPSYTAELKVGGRYLGCMQSPEGQSFWSGGEFLEIDPPRRIVTLDHFSDENGNIIDPSTFGFDPAWPKQMKVTVTFDELAGNRTRLTVVQSVPTELAKTVQADTGWVQMLDKLADHLAT